MKPFFGQEKMKLLPELYEKLLKESLKSKGKMTLDGNLALEKQRTCKIINVDKHKNIFNF